MNTSELIVCTTCRPAGADRNLPAAGQALLDAVLSAVPNTTAAQPAPGATDPTDTTAPAPPRGDVAVRGIACLSGCSRACTVALQAPGKPSYVFGDLVADAETAAQVLACARLHAGSADGQLARSDRPERLRSGLLIRLPAWASATATATAATAAGASPLDPCP
jgi:predicted metal-binding protein